MSHVFHLSHQYIPLCTRFWGTKSQIHLKILCEIFFIKTWIWKLWAILDKLKDLQRNVTCVLMNHQYIRLCTRFWGTKSQIHLKILLEFFFIQTLIWKLWAILDKLKALQLNVTCVPPESSVYTIMYQVLGYKIIDSPQNSFGVFFYLDIDMEIMGYFRQTKGFTT